MASVERVADDLERPVVDDRSYRVICLPNKLEALLVHDPNTDKASASMNVEVGNFSDDSDMPGMAHAVEHLLFMGTKKYPNENAYHQYLAAHSGYPNAYTEGTETNYYFEVAAKAAPQAKNANLSGSITPGYSREPTMGRLSNLIMHGIIGSGGPSSDDPVSPLYGALDRFAQFFISPLFLPSTLDRELRVVDSENKKNLQSDRWRLFQLNKALCNPRHPYHNFSTGNLQTLRDNPRKKGVDVRSKLMKFHEKQYSANRMKLVVLGRESLNKLESWVAELFAGVKNKELPQNRWDDVQPLAPEDMLKQIFARPVMDTRSLDITFPYQDEDHMYEEQPSEYISHLIGHEGPGSILAYIKAKGWATKLFASATPICPGFAVFTISIELTEDGLKEYSKVVKVVFQYISLIKEQPPRKWIFDEMKNLSEIDFRFRQKSPASCFTSHLSSIMHKPVPRKWLLSGYSVPRKFDPELINSSLEFLRADNFNILLISQHHPGTWDMKEKWYGTDYKVEKIPDDLLLEIRQILETATAQQVPGLHVPQKNEFIPTELDVQKQEVPQPSKRPALIQNDDHARTWHKKDDTFWVPKAAIKIILRNPLVYATPENNVMSRIYCSLVRDALTEYSYDAKLAGLHYSLSASPLGLEVSVVGYNDKLAVLLEKVLLSMRDLKIKTDRFRIIRERLTREFKNAEYREPYLQVSYYVTYLTAEKAWTNEQFAPELEHIQADDIAAFFPKLLRQTYVEILAHGNLYKKDAFKISELIESILKPDILPKSQWHVRRNIMIPPGSNFIYEHTLKDPANINHCINYYLFVGSLTDVKLRAKLHLFGQMTDEPAFHQLRTQEQLGYAVRSGPHYSYTTIGYQVMIQSEWGPNYLESRVNAFLSCFAKTLNAMSDEEFKSHKRSIINEKLEKLKNLDSETRRFWSHIDSEYFDFVQHENDAEAIDSLSKSEMVDFFRQYIDPRSPFRAKLSVHMKAQSSGNAVATADQKARAVEKLEETLSSVGIKVDSVRFKELFENMDISDGGHEVILSAVSNFLQRDMRLPADQVIAVLGQGTTKPEYIVDVSEFKARLAFSAGSSPVVNLSEFEDLEPKL